MTVPVKFLIDTIFERHNADWRIKIVRNWQIIVGNLHTKMRVEKIQEDIIFLGVYDTVWMAELYMLSRLIIKKINQFLEHPYITQVRFRLTQKIIRKPVSVLTLQSKVPEKQLILTERQKQALTAIKDPALQVALKNFLLRCTQVM